MSQSAQVGFNQISSLQTSFEETRSLSLKLVENLSDADATVQSMEDASPAKWHLAHTTWFFETLILKDNLPNYRLFNEKFAYLFNSYYESLGERHPRPRRGMLTRPTLETVFEYRKHVDMYMAEFLNSPHASEELQNLTTLGIHHEQQHQELLLTDILHMFAQNPLKPEYAKGQPIAYDDKPPSKLNWIEFEGGLFEFGCDGSADFSYDCEGPNHKAYLEDFALSNRLITNREWINFMDDEGYDDPLYWLSDGWAMRIDQNWMAPLYWEKHDDVWGAMTLRGFQPVDLDAPVTHISLFEADAYARYMEARLPTEYEWELAAGDQSLKGNMLDSERLRPAPSREDTMSQMFGDVWEWTQSSYAPYPGYQCAQGAVGEYNGKFMNAQYVLRGGSCVTPKGHIRKTYRNFFHPDKRWQFSGLRLAKNLK